MLLVCAYTLLTAATTTDAALVTNSGTSPLPIVGSRIAIVRFYLVMPVLLLGFYVYFHLYTQRLWESLAVLPRLTRGLSRRAEARQGGLPLVAERSRYGSSKVAQGGFAAVLLVAVLGFSAGRLGRSPCHATGPLVAVSLSAASRRVVLVGPCAARRCRLGPLFLFGSPSHAPRRAVVRTGRSLTTAALGGGGSRVPAYPFLGPIWRWGAGTEAILAPLQWATTALARLSLITLAPFVGWLALRRIAVGLLSRRHGTVLIGFALVLLYCAGSAGNGERPLSVS